MHVVSATCQEQLLDLINNKGVSGLGRHLVGEHDVYGVYYGKGAARSIEDIWARSSWLY